MESKQILAIGLLSALLGGIIGGGVTLYYVNPQINEISNALTDSTDALSEISNTLTENANTLTEITNAIGIQEDQIDETDSNISNLRNEIEDIQEVVTEITLKPSLHFAYNERLFEPSDFDSESGKFEVKGQTGKLIMISASGMRVLMNITILGCRF